MTDQDDDDVRWLTISEAADHLAVSRATLYTYMKDGRLPYYYIQGSTHRRVKRSDLDALLVRGRPEDVKVNDADE